MSKLLIWFQFHICPIVTCPKALRPETGALKPSPNLCLWGSPPGDKHPVFAFGRLPLFGQAPWALNHTIQH